MRILQVNKFLYRKAGAESYLLGLAELLAAHGHEVGLWGTKAGVRCQVSGVRCFEDLLVEPLNFDRREGLWQDLKKVGHMIWSPEARWKFGKAIRKFRPEIIHIHNIYHQLSPSILRAAGRYKIPVVMTVHDYHLINPNYALYDHGAICERCGLAAIFHRCIKNSFAASFADVLEWRLHRMMGVYERYVTKFLVPTAFVKEKLVEGGMDANKIVLIPLPVIHNPSQPPLILRGGDRSEPPLKVRGGRGSYVLFSGRLVVEKGIYLILELAKSLPEIKFKIAGGGPEEDNLALQVTRYKLQNVELLGFKEKSVLDRFVAGARLVIVPSLWYEPSPLAILEAMAQGKVVVASRIGGITNLIEDGKTGFLVDRWIDPVRGRSPKGGRTSLQGGSASNGIDTITKIYYNEALLKKVGKTAQAYVRSVHDPKKHYEKIMEIYRSSMR